MARKRSAPSNAKRAAAPSTGAGRPVTASLSESTTDRIVWICLHLLVSLVPLAVANPSVIGIQAMPITYDQFDIVKVFVMRALVTIGAAAWLWGLLTRGARVRVPREIWVVVAFLAWVALTTVFSVHPLTALFGKYRRFEGLISFVTYAVAFFLALQVVDRPSRIRSLARTLVVSGVLVSAYGVAQRLGLDPARWGTLPFESLRAFSTYGNPDLLGGYLMFPLAVSLGLALSEERQGARVAYWGAFAITGLCLLVSYVRGAWIGGTLAIIVMGVAAFRVRARWGSTDWGAVGVAAVLAAIETVRSLRSTDGVTNVFERIRSIFEFGQGSALTRFQIWQAAIAAIKERPILGWGADTFRLLFPRFKPLAYTATAGYLSVADNVHNYPLQLASAIGIPGVLIAYGFFAWTLIRSARHAFASQAGGSRLAYTGFWAASLGYIVHLFFGLSVTGSTIFLWLSLGVLLSPSARVHEVEAPSWGVVPAAGVLLVAGALLVGNVIYLRADNYHLKARILSNGMARVENAKRAVELNPSNDMYRTEVGLAWQDLFMSAIAQGLPDAAAREQALAYFKEAERSLIEVIEFVPMEYDNYVFLANLYNQGAYYLDPAYADKAIDIAKRGIEVEPYGPAIRLQLAVAYANLGRYTEAAAVARECVRQDPNYIDGWSMLGDAERLAGNLEAAKEAYEKALAIQRRADIEASLRAVEASLAATTTP